MFTRGTQGSARLHHPIVPGIPLFDAERIIHLQQSVSLVSPLGPLSHNAGRRQAQKTAS